MRHIRHQMYSAVLMMIGVRISGKASDKDHPYGHERMECAVAIVIGYLQFCRDRCWYWLCRSQDITWTVNMHLRYRTWHLIAAVVSILVKEAMFCIPDIMRRRLIPAVMADAWHHRSDALSSVGN